MSIVIASLKRVSDPKLRTDDDRVDRLSHRYTPAILVLFSMLVSTKQYVGEPIDCWAPNHFKARHVEYANSYCWISGTFHVPFNSSIPSTAERYAMERSSYYQWIPLILLLQALIFNVPCLLWRSLSERSGVDINSLVITGEMLATVQMSKDIREGLLNRMLRQINRYLDSFQKPSGLSLTLSLKHLFSQTCCFMCGHKNGNYLTALYITTKVLYLINAVGQLFVLDLLLGQDYHLYGLEVLGALSRGEEWTGSYRFPRVNLCDFKLRRLGQNVQQHTLQCVLPINLFNEKIFLFLWFWFIFISIVTAVDLIIWLVRILAPKDRNRFIKSHLVRAGAVNLNDPKDKKGQAVMFAASHLCQDGVFLLRLIQHSTNPITTMELTLELWKSYLAKLQQNDPNKNGPSATSASEAPTLPLSWKYRKPSKNPTAPPQEIEAKLAPQSDDIKPPLDGAVITVV